MGNKHNYSLTAILGLDRKIFVGGNEIGRLSMKNMAFPCRFFFDVPSEDEGEAPVRY